MVYQRDQLLLYLLAEYMYCTNIFYCKVTKRQPKWMICRCNTWNTRGLSKNISVHHFFFNRYYYNPSLNCLIDRFLFPSSISNCTLILVSNFTLNIVSGDFSITRSITFRNSVKFSLSPYIIWVLQRSLCHFRSINKLGK